MAGPGQVGWRGAGGWKARSPPWRVTEEAQRLAWAISAGRALGRGRIFPGRPLSAPHFCPRGRQGVPSGSSHRVATVTLLATQPTGPVPFPEMRPHVPGSHRGVCRPSCRLGLLTGLLLPPWPTPSIFSPAAGRPCLSSAHNTQSESKPEIHSHLQAAPLPPIFALAVPPAGRALPQLHTQLLYASRWCGLWYITYLQQATVHFIFVD